MNGLTHTYAVAPLMTVCQACTFSHTHTHTRLHPHNHKHTAAPFMTVRQACTLSPSLNGQVETGFPLVGLKAALEITDELVDGVPV